METLSHMARLGGCLVSLRLRQRFPCALNEQFELALEMFRLNPQTLRDMRWNRASENLEHQLRDVVQELLRKAISFEPPRVRVIYQNIAPESVRDIDNKAAARVPCSRG